MNGDFWLPGCHPNDLLYFGAGNITTFQSPAVRVSQLLGPDGEPLLVGYERPKVGFDLSPKKSG